MTVANGIRAGARAEIRGESNQALANDPVNSQRGFVPTRREVEAEYANELAEIQRSPESAFAIVDGEAGDAKLMRRILTENNDWWGIRGLLHEAKTNDYTRVIGVGIAANVARTSLRTALDVSNPVASAAVGAATGLFVGYIRGKDQTETATTWMSELGILEANVDELDAMEDGVLETALGIMEQAIEDNRVRGNNAQRFEMVVKYRRIKDILTERRANMVENGIPEEQRNAVMKRVDGALIGSEHQNESLAKMAAGQNEALYKTLVEAKKHKTFMIALRGGVVGLVTSGLVSFVLEHGGLNGAIDWLRDHIAHPNAAAHESVNQAIDAHAQHLAGSAQIQDEVLRHGQNAQGMRDLADSVSRDPLMPLDGAQQQAMSHWNMLHSIGTNGNVEGFQQNLTQFNDILSHGHGSMNELITVANNHNIDLKAVLSNGQRFSDVLVQNKSLFLSMTPETQNFILSHPSAATDLFEFAKGATATTVGSLLSKFSAYLGLAAIGTGVGAFLYGQRGMNRDNRKIRKGLDERKATLQAEIAPGVIELRKSRDVNLQKSKDQLLNAQWVRFPGDAQLYRVTDIDGHGRVFVVMVEDATPADVVPPGAPAGTPPVRSQPVYRDMPAPIVAPALLDLNIQDLVRPIRPGVAIVPGVDYTSDNTLNPDAVQLGTPKPPPPPKPEPDASKKKT